MIEWIERHAMRFEQLAFGVGGGSLQPVTISRRCIREMDRSIQRWPTRAVAPNVFRVLLSPREFTRFARVRDRLERDIAREVTRAAAETHRRYDFVGGVNVKVIGADDFGEGEVRVLIDFDASVSLRESVASRPAAAADEPTRLIETAPVAASRGWLRLADGSRRHLSAGLTKIGRRRSCDVVLSDPAVSAEHCVLEAVNGSYLVRDLQSRNGLFVNGRRVAQYVLGSGDVVRLGVTDIVFRTS